MNVLGKRSRNGGGGVDADEVRTKKLCIGDQDPAVPQYCLPELRATVAGQVLTDPLADGTVVWTSVPGTGDVVGPGSSGDNAIAVFDGVTGKAIKETPVTLTSAGELTWLAPNDALVTVTSGDLKTIAEQHEFTSTTGQMVLVGETDTLLESLNGDLDLVATNGTAKLDADGIATVVSHTDIVNIESLTSDVEVKAPAGDVLVTAANEVSLTASTGSGSLSSTSAGVSLVGATTASVEAGTGIASLSSSGSTAIVNAFSVAEVVSSNSDAKLTSAVGDAIVSAPGAEAKVTGVSVNIDGSSTVDLISGGDLTTTSLTTTHTSTLDTSITSSSGDIGLTSSGGDLTLTADTVKVLSSNPVEVDNEVIIGSGGTEWTIPSTRGTAGQVLTDVAGDGNAAWQDPVMDGDVAYGDMHMQGNATATPTTVQNQYETIAGTILNTTLEAMTFGSKQLTYTGSADLTALVNVALSWIKADPGLSETYCMAVFHNGSILARSEVCAVIDDAVTQFPRNASTTCLVELKTNDTLECKVACVSNNINIVIQDYSFTATSVEAGVLTAAGNGDVVGPGSATNNGLCTYNGTTGKLIQSGPGLVAAGRLEGLGIRVNASPNNFDLPSNQPPEVGMLIEATSAAGTEWRYPKLVTVWSQTEFNFITNRNTETSLIVHNGEGVGNRMTPVNPPDGTQVRIHVSGLSQVGNAQAISYRVYFGGTLMNEVAFTNQQIANLNTGWRYDSIMTTKTGGTQCYASGHVTKIRNNTTGTTQDLLQRANRGFDWSVSQLIDVRVQMTLAAFSNNFDTYTASIDIVRP